MGLDLRVMHCTPTNGARVWDVKLLDGRQNVRLFPVTGDTSEFIDIILTGADTKHPSYIAITQPEPGNKVKKVKSISKTQRRKRARKGK